MNRHRIIEIIRKQDRHDIVYDGKGWIFEGFDFSELRNEGRDPVTNWLCEKEKVQKEIRKLPALP